MNPTPRSRGGSLNRSVAFCKRPNTTRPPSFPVADFFDVPWSANILDPGAPGTQMVGYYTHILCTPVTYYLGNWSPRVRQASRTPTYLELADFVFLTTLAVAFLLEALVLGSHVTVPISQHCQLLVGWISTFVRVALATGCGKARSF